ncbi:MAG TPA: Xaa-Pro peptidase family protein [Vicinamibacteria bacterium]|nr:Xaa-Pro peptidase family protein [Vicinamibacteria bacterium]
MRARAVSFVVLLGIAFGSGATGQDAPLFTTDFPPEEFAARRAKVMDAIGQDGIALVQGAGLQEGYSRFRQSNEFYYLCGVETPNAYLLLDGASRRTTLYLPHRNVRREGSDGKLLSADDAELAAKLTGVDAVAGLDLLPEHLARYGSSGQTRALFTPLLPAEGLSVSRWGPLQAVGQAAADPFDGRPSREGAFARSLRERFPWLEVKNLTPTLDAARLIKSPREIALIKRATRLACLAILEAMRSTEPGLVEHELDGVSRFVFYRHGAQGEAYYSLVASGENAWYPHYAARKRRMRDGEMLLMDHAPDFGYYMSDITRMWPVNGRFSPEQRELYGFYLATYRAILKAIRPGATKQTVMEEAAAEMDRILAATRFSKPAYAQAAKAFVEAYRESAKRGGLGHWVGMSTHDVGQDTLLRPGMVFTIEPQFRVPEEKGYWRLEDLIVIGQTKAEVVSEWLPMEMDAIETVMREPGILQRYPRDAGDPGRP